MSKPFKPLRRVLLFLAAIVFAVLLNVPGYANTYIAQGTSEDDPCQLGMETYTAAEDLTVYSEDQLFCLFEEELEDIELDQEESNQKKVDAIVYGLADWGDNNDNDDDDDVITEANLSEVLPPSEVRNIAESVAETTAQFLAPAIALEQKGQQFAQTIAEKSVTIKKQLRSPIDRIWQKLQLIAADNSTTAGYSKAFAKAVSNKKKNLS
ncbi:MAG: hypothetical protein KME16_10190 [Scytolyngbya sp. HA4215-MV1]|jgi:hypothetical protein|nr:hypothetical protein [Scytolyngbya sp. HA4215-MV1]